MSHKIAMLALAVAVSYAACAITSSTKLNKIPGTATVGEIVTAGGGTGTITDVQTNGVTVVSNGVANIKIRTDAEIAYIATNADAKAYWDGYYQTKITAIGILKGDGDGGVTNATAGTDYVAAETDPQWAAWTNGTRVALGRMAKASGNRSTASGYRSTASGSDSKASGAFSTARGTSSTASGYRSTASGYRAIALGGGNVTKAQATNSVAIAAATVSGDYAIGIGTSASYETYTTVTNEEGEISIDTNLVYSSTATVTDDGTRGIAIGGGVTVSNAQAVAIGTGARSHGDDTITLGGEAVTADDVYIGDANVGGMFAAKVSASQYGTNYLTTASAIVQASKNEAGTIASNLFDEATHTLTITNGDEVITYDGKENKSLAVSAGTDEGKVGEIATNVVAEVYGTNTEITVGGDGFLEISLSPSNTWRWVDTPIFVATTNLVSYRYGTSIIYIDDGAVVSFTTNNWPDTASIYAIFDPQGSYTITNSYGGVGYTVTRVDDDEDFTNRVQAAVWRVGTNFFYNVIGDPIPGVKTDAERAAMEVGE